MQCKPRKFTECPHCKKLFSPLSAQVWYCSDDCRDEARRLRQRTRAKYIYDLTSVEEAKQKAIEQEQATRLQQTKFINSAKSDVDNALKRLGL